MSIAIAILTVLILGACAARLALTALGLRAVTKLDRLADLDPPAPSRWPRVTLVLPARNEAATIEAAAESKLRQDYPDLEMVLVDDRSTDGTAAAADALAARDGRVRVLHLAGLPQGWLGKVHALHLAVAQSKGEWILLSDADVCLAPTAVRRAVAYAEHRGLDFLTVVPEFLPVSRVIDVAMADLMRSLLPLLQPDLIELPRSRLGVGGGAFMLVRRSAYELTPGFEALKCEVLDDMAFGQMVKEAGGRCGVAIGRGLVRLAFYTSVGDFARGTEKAFASVGRCSLTRLLAFTVISVAVNLAPLVAVAAPFLPSWVRGSAAGALAFDLAGSVVMSMSAGGRVAPALLAPLGVLLTAPLLVRSAWLAVVRGGIVWRGTLYRTAELRTGMRYRFPWEWRIFPASRAKGRT
jgi:hypothetical protein